MLNDENMPRDLNYSVNGPTRGYPLSGNDCTMRSCKDQRTIASTAGKFLELLSNCKGMEVQMIGTLSASSSNHLTILDHTGDFPCLDEVIRSLDSSGILDLKHWERLGPDRIFLVYGPGDSIMTF